jgi:hypothetical protein
VVIAGVAIVVVDPRHRRRKAKQTG